MKTKNEELQFVHRFIPSSNTDDVTLFVLHGTGGDENDLLALAKAIRPTAAILSPRGKILENGMNRFFARLSPGVFDLTDLRKQTKELAEFINRATKKHSINPNQLVAVGYSNGANMAVNLMLNYPVLLCGAVLLRPLLPNKPSKIPDLSNQKILVLGGERDTLISPGQTKELIEYLRTTKAQLSVNWQSVGHELTQTDIAIAREWMQRTFK